jgi:hypothetical protein
MTERNIDIRLREHGREGAPWIGLTDEMRCAFVLDKDVGPEVEKSTIANSCPTYNTRDVPEECRVLQEVQNELIQVLVGGQTPATTRNLARQA